MLQRFLDKLKQANWEPHSGQIAYLVNQARFRVLACGRRWGKTDAAAAAIAFNVIEGKRTKQVAIAPTLTQAKIVFERVCWMLTVAGVVFTATMTPHPSLRVFENPDSKKSGVIHILDARSGHEADNLRGIGADHVLLDEAAYLSQSVIMEIAMPMLAATNGRMTLISTPRGRNLFYRLFLRGETNDPEFWSYCAPSEENPQVSPHYLDLQKEILPERIYKTEYEAQFLATAESVFDYEDIEACLDAPLVNGTLVAGIDWGRYNDNTAIVLLRHHENHAEVVDVKAFTGLKFSTQLDKVIEIVKGARFIFCDSTGIGIKPTEDLAAALKNCYVEGIQFTQKTKAAIVEQLQSLIEKHRIRIPGDPELLRELENFEADAYENGIRYGAPGGLKDDRVIALGLACLGVGRGTAARIMTKERRII